MTLQPGITPPVGSTTEPSSRPVPTCAKQREAASKNRVSQSADLGNGKRSLQFPVWTNPNVPSPWGGRPIPWQICQSIPRLIFTFSCGGSGGVSTSPADRSKEQSSPIAQARGEHKSLINRDLANVRFKFRVCRSSCRYRRQRDRTGLKTGTAQCVWRRRQS